MIIPAVIGATALWLLFVWLLSAAIGSWISDRKGYGEKVGLAFGLLLSAIGLLPAGIGAVVFAPIAAVKAWRTSQKPLNGHQRRQVRMALLYADVLFVLGLLLGFVFLLHL